MYAVCLIGSVDWKLWGIVREREIKGNAKCKMQAENKLLVHGNNINHKFSLIGISWGKEITGETQASMVR